MIKKFLVLLLAVSFSGCTTDTKSEAEINESVESVIRDEDKSLLQLGCYTFKNDRNLVNFEITDLSNGVTGKLVYEYDAKDRNEGTFAGEAEGDKLYGNYTFMSEGVTSTREIAFKINGDRLIEGYGDLTDDGTKFQDKNNIEYSSTMPLTKTDCEI